MGDNLDLPERNCARTPMQWSTEPHAGFTESDRPCAPVIDKGPYGYEHVNVAKQRRDPNSMLNWTERIVRMRKEVPEIGWGDFKIIAVRDPAVLVIRYDWRNNSVLFVHNLDEKPREFSFAVGLPGEAGKLLVNLLTEDHSRADERGKHTLHAGRLWLPLVSGRRPRLSAEAQRHRYRRHRQDQSSGVRAAFRLQSQRDLAFILTRFLHANRRLLRYENAVSSSAEDHAFIAAQIERALHLLALAVEKCRQQDFAAEADRT